MGQALEALMDTEKMKFSASNHVCNNNRNHEIKTTSTSTTPPPPATTPTAFTTTNYRRTCFIGSKIKALYFGDKSRIQPCGDDSIC
jgi:hypothetical protein